MQSTPHQQSRLPIHRWGPPQHLPTKRARHTTLKSRADLSLYPAVVHVASAMNDDARAVRKPDGAVPAPIQPGRGLMIASFRISMRVIVAIARMTGEPSSGCNAVRRASVEEGPGAHASRSNTRVHAATRSGMLHTGGHRRLQLAAR